MKREDNQSCQFGGQEGRNNGMKGKQLNLPRQTGHMVWRELRKQMTVRRMNQEEEGQSTHLFFDILELLLQANNVSSCK